MGRKPLLQARVEQDTKETFDAYFDDQREDMSQSEAVRLLIRAGLGKKGYSVTMADGGSPIERLAEPFTIQLGVIFGVLGILSGVLGMIYPSYAFLAVAGLSIGMTAMTVTFLTAALAQLALARPLRALVGIGSEVKP